MLGWKEFEMEVVRDRADNCIIVCSIENVDPMGVHTGDFDHRRAGADADRQGISAHARRLDRVLREIGVDTGGSNVQFAVNPADGRMVVIEMNPRVSRSSALASKATGFPIAKIAAKLAVGYTLDELENDITRRHAGLVRADHRLRRDQDPPLHLREIPRRRALLTTSMKSVGEAMAIGRTLRREPAEGAAPLETGLTGLDEIAIPGLGQGDDKNAIRAALGTPTPDRPADGRAGDAARPERSRTSTPPAKSTRGSCAQIARIVDAEARDRAPTACRATPARCAA